MAKTFVLITLAVTFILLQTAHAASFECADEPAVCKTKFATQFENDFKDMHLTAVRKILTTYSVIFNTLKAEVPADSPLAKFMSERISITTKALEKINENVGDNKKFIAAVEEGMHKVEVDLKNVPDKDEFKKLVEKHGFGGNINEILRKLGVDAGNLWAEMYKGLRDEDLSTYPEYAEVNVLMENLKGSEAKASDFMQATEILGTKFNLPYFAELRDIL